MSTDFNIGNLHRRSWELMTRGTISDFWRKPKRIEAMNIFKRIAHLGIRPRPNFARYCQRDAEIRRGL